MRIHIFTIQDGSPQRPSLLMKDTNLPSFKEEFNFCKMKESCQKFFIDAELEEETESIEKNIEAVQLMDLLQVPTEIIEEIITDQRPRADDYHDFCLILFKCTSIANSDKINGSPVKNYKVIEYQVGIIIKDNIAIAIHKKIPTLPIDEIYKRFQKYPMKIVKGGLTYFVVTYLDLMIDKIYRVVNVWDKILDEYQRRMIEKPDKVLLNDIFELKAHLLDLVKILQADREVISNIRRLPEFIIPEGVPPELDDHIKHLLDDSDILRALLTDITNIYYNADSAILNNTMKRFTFMTGLILVPTLISGIFGMNNYSGSPMEFYLVMFVIAAVVVGMFAYFKKKRYI